MCISCICGVQHGEFVTAPATDITVIPFASVTLRGTGDKIFVGV